MAGELEDLYREVILDHAKHPRGAGLREPFTVEVHQVNPTCGDEVTLRLLLTGATSAGVAGAVVADVSYDSLGCSISVAAASVLAESVTGQPLAAALARYEAYHGLVTGAVSPGAASAAGTGTEGDAGGVEESEDDMVAFAGVAKFPGRVKCALLGWTAFREAVVRAGG